ncbi:MAG: hypothetical protein PHG00_01340 [Methylococcales bacterium]|nr:hypothetical protein [Methylococcales bacterium]
MRIRHFALIIIFTFSWSAEGGPLSGDAGKIPSLTRQVKTFSELENDLIEALKSRNQLKLDQLVAEDFEMRTAASPDNPVPYSEWLKTSLEEASAYTFHIGRMAVHDLNENAIVSFVWDSFADNKQGIRNVFLVDVWKKQGVAWKLAIRYASPVQDADIKVPGFSGKEPVIEKKY